MAAGFLVGGLVVLVLVLLRRVTLRASITFGPSMILGTYLCGLMAPVL